MWVTRLANVADSGYVMDMDTNTTQDRKERRTMTNRTHSTKTSPVYTQLNETGRIRVEQAIREGRACTNCGSGSHSFCNR